MRVQGQELNVHDPWRVLLEKIADGLLQNSFTDNPVEQNRYTTFTCQPLPLQHPKQVKPINQSMTASQCLEARTPSKSKHSKHSIIRKALLFLICRQLILSEPRENAYQWAKDKERLQLPIQMNNLKATELTQIVNGQQCFESCLVHIIQTHTHTTYTSLCSTYYYYPHVIYDELTLPTSQIVCIREFR